MKIRVLGGGWYGSHIALALLGRGHDVELHELAGRLFAGASGANPARLHQGFHYPRSALTRAMCREHRDHFMRQYGHLTRGVPVNIYAIAAYDSLIDYGTFVQTLRSEGAEFIAMQDPAEYGFGEIEGAVQTGERHIVIAAAREHFTQALSGRIQFGRSAAGDDADFDMTIDCTFCANDARNIDRYEPCLTVLLEGPSDTAFTVMDGPFPSIYPWDEANGLLSLTSASLTPLSKDCQSYGEAKRRLAHFTRTDAKERAAAMMKQMARYWPRALQLFRPVDYLLSIRAQPRSGADARLVDVVRTGERRLRVRAGKIDAVFHAERVVVDTLDSMAAQRQVAA